MPPDPGFFAFTRLHTPSHALTLFFSTNSIIEDIDMSTDITHKSTPQSEEAAGCAGSRPATTHKGGTDKDHSPTGEDAAASRANSVTSQPSLLPTELLEIEDLLFHRFAPHLEGRLFSVTTYSQDPYLTVVITLSSDDDSFYYPVEARVHLIDQDTTPRRSALMMIDYLSLYFEEYFDSDGEVLLPIDWTPHLSDNIEFYLRAQVRNKKLEDQANRLLAENHPTRG